MVELVYGFLNSEEIDLVNDFCLNFKIENNPPEKYNSYLRMMLNTETDLVEYQSKIKKHLLNTYGINCVIDGIWINKITTSTNRNDKFHLDKSEISIVSYLNDNFTGGEYEYFNNKNEKLSIKPKKNLSLITNNTIKHRVAPVNVGERYSIVVFCSTLIKNKKTIF